jgi:hypothetical protein
MKTITMVAGLLLMLGVLTRPVPAVSAAPRCFIGVPGITNCIDGPIHNYWEQNGGLSVFGYPITAAHLTETTAGAVVAQAFERNRLEVHPENKPPYDVLLGRMGADRLAQLGRHDPPESQPGPGCLWFEETRHSVCDMLPGQGFKSYWSSHGLADSRMTAYARSLALFGLPLTAMHLEASTGGKMVITQWFERARFEWHPDNTPDQRVLLGLLGNELQPVNSSVSLPAGSTGLAVDILIGPTCPGPQIEDRPCPDKPYQATLALVTAGTRALVRQFQTDAQGHFALAVPAGNYILVPQLTAKFPRAGEQAVTVVRGQVTHIIMHYDSGMR